MSAPHRVRRLTNASCTGSFFQSTTRAYLIIGLARDLLDLILNSNLLGDPYSIWTMLLNRRRSLLRLIRVFIQVNDIHRLESHFRYAGLTFHSKRGLLLWVEKCYAPIAFTSTLIPIPIILDIPRGPKYATFLSVLEMYVGYLEYMSSDSSGSYHHATPCSWVFLLPLSSQLFVQYTRMLYATSYLVVRGLPHYIDIH